MKNSEPIILPAGITLKMFGKVINIRSGPALTGLPKAKHAGKIIKPEVNATKVSKLATVTASPRSARSLFM